jgi:hypothetical protein
MGTRRPRRVFSFPLTHAPARSATAIARARGSRSWKESRAVSSSPELRKRYTTLGPCVSARLRSKSGQVEAGIEGCERERNVKSLSLQLPQNFRSRLARQLPPAWVNGSVQGPRSEGGTGIWKGVVGATLMTCVIPPRLVGALAPTHARIGTLCAFTKWDRPVLVHP